MIEGTKHLGLINLNYEKLKVDINAKIEKISLRKMIINQAKFLTEPNEHTTMYRIKKAFAFVLLIGAMHTVSAAEPRQMQIIKGNVNAPEVQFSDGNRSLSLTSLKGKYLLVNFWATWCVPCVREMPALDRLATRLEKNELVVIAVSQDEGGATLVDPFVKKLNLKKILVLYDQDKKAFRHYSLRGLPTTVLISPTGKLIARLEGEAAWDEGPLFDQVRELSNITK